MTTEAPAGAPAEEIVTPPAGAPEAPVVVSEVTPPAGTPPAAAPGAAETGSTPAAPKDPGKTLAADGGTADDPAKAGDAKWPDDWRETLANGDEALLKQLKRYTSPANFAKAGHEAQLRIRAGEAKAPLPKDATPEQLEAFRKENGIPEKPEGYEPKPSNGYVFGEADKPALDSFKAHAHAHNWTPEQFNVAADWYAQEQERMVAAQAEQDAGFKQEADDQLRADWGPDYRRNLSTVQNFLATAPDGLADRLLGGRLADGRRAGDDPAMLQWLARTARELNPLATVVPAGVTDQGKAVADELGELKKMMADQRSAYWKGPDSVKNQARYRELIGAQRQAAKRG
ncbi:hypothetical protein [Methylobacterium iners]|uniref:Uncharacterized protein n=1 Tax=Methylobacterium iners TaxID=418707 RepID=A0ABQ4RTD1_9HYPH|nr:hypothetical protein [Methylobacterium iners]GJD92928.1 hypothetical protein OCOJLMKI_0111 [Methylobacterium iners]